MLYGILSVPMAAASARNFFFVFLALAVRALWGFFSNFLAFVFLAGVREAFFTTRFVAFFALDFFFALRAMPVPRWGRANSLVRGGRKPLYCQRVNGHRLTFNELERIPVILDIRHC
jgi:hypothetical protein